MLGMTLVTHQTGPQGRAVKRLYVEDGCDIARELYLSLVVDRGTGRVTLIASTEGGMDIEEVAAHTPAKILTIPIDTVVGLSAHYEPRLAFGLGLQGQHGPADRRVGNRGVRTCTNTWAQYKKK